MTRHVIQDVECPSCTTLGGPCATTHPSRVAWPVYVLEGYARMSKLVRVARALKVLYGPDLIHKQTTYHHVWFTPGTRCHCAPCDAHLDRLLRGPHDA